MGKSLKFSKIKEGQTTIWRLEIQYQRVDQIHPDRLIGDLIRGRWAKAKDGRIPIFFEKESSNFQEILDMSRHMSEIYSPNEWNFVIAIINSNTSIVN